MRKILKQMMKALQTMQRQKKRSPLLREVKLRLMGRTPLRLRMMRKTVGAASLSDISVENNEKQIKINVLS